MDWMSRQDPRIVAIGASVVAAVGLFAAYKIRQKHIKAQRKELIALTTGTSPLLSPEEQKVAAADLKAAAAEPPKPPAPDLISPEDVRANLKSVKHRIAAAKRPQKAPPTLVAVSKTKPVELLMAAYDAGQREFGENYVHEVTTKGPAMPPDVRFHFIGHLQTNKVKELLSVPSLHCVHTVDTLKLAHELQKRCLTLRPTRPLYVMVQVNTSGEESKSGCKPEAAADLCLQVQQLCPNLILSGLMCIGKYSAAEGGAEDDFRTLIKCRTECAKALGMADDGEGLGGLGLSMGMSHDFETALGFGATYVRVGSTIFGARAAKK